MASDPYVTIGMREDDNRQHVYPTWGRPHVTRGTGCWCNPKFQKPCGQCDGEGCWNCEDGWVETDVESDALVIVHHAEKEL